MIYYPVASGTIPADSDRWGARKFTIGPNGSRKGPMVNFRAPQRKWLNSAQQLNPRLQPKAATVCI